MYRSLLFVGFSILFLQKDVILNMTKKIQILGSLVKSKIRVADVELLASNWVGAESPYSQIVNIEGITAYSQVDITPNVSQLDIFRDKDLSFVTENEDGIVTVFAIGDKPANDYVVQVTITEVAV